MSAGCVAASAGHGVGGLAASKLNFFIELSIQKSSFSFTAGKRSIFFFLEKSVRRTSQPGLPFKRLAMEKYLISSAASAAGL